MIESGAMRAALGSLVSQTPPDFGGLEPEFTPNVPSSAAPHGNTPDQMSWSKLLDGRGNSRVAILELRKSEMVAEDQLGSFGTSLISDPLKIRQLFHIEPFAGFIQWEFSAIC